MLESVLAKLPPQAANPALLLGNENGDDAAVFKISEDQALVATTDFFMPVVDDPYDFGRIAAANALSDVYAVGGRPVLALAIAAIPVGKMSPDSLQQVLSGGAAVCAAAGVPVAGGHTIDALEPIYGLAVVGLVHPDKILRNDGARDGDVLILSKPLGVGILSAAENKAELDREGYDQLVASATKLNSVGTRLAEVTGVHAMTDVTGFGLLGHLYEMCRGAKLAAHIRSGDLPYLSSALSYAERGYNTGAAGRNWQSFGHHVTLPAGLADWRKNLLVDPQTSGGLLIACNADAADTVMEELQSNGFGDSRVFGSFAKGQPHIQVE